MEMRRGVSIPSTGVRGQEDERVHGGVVGVLLGSLETHHDDARGVDSRTIQLR